MKSLTGFSFLPFLNRLYMNNSAYFEVLIDFDLSLLNELGIHISKESLLREFNHTISYFFTNFGIQSLQKTESSLKDPK